MLTDWGYYDLTGFRFPTNGGGGGALEIPRSFAPKSNKNNISTTKLSQTQRDNEEPAKVQRNGGFQDQNT